MTRKQQIQQIRDRWGLKPPEKTGGPLRSEREERGEIAENVIDDSSNRVKRTEEKP